MDAVKVKNAKTKRKLDEKVEGRKKSTTT